MAKSRGSRWSGAALLIVLGLGPALVAAERAKKSPSGPFAERKALMEQVGKNAKAIGDALKAGKPANAAAPAEAIAAVMDKFVTLFPPGSQDPKSRAKPEIWQQKSEFDTIAGTLKEKATAFAAAAKSGGDTKAASAPMWAQCKACHDKFRVPKKGE